MPCFDNAIAYSNFVLPTGVSAGSTNGSIKASSPIPIGETTISVTFDVAFSNSAYPGTAIS